MLENKSIVLLCHTKWHIRFLYPPISAFAEMSDNKHIIINNCSVNCFLFSLKLKKKITGYLLVWTCIRWMNNTQVLSFILNIWHYYLENVVQLIKNLVDTKNSQTIMTKTKYHLF